MAGACGVGIRVRGAPSQPARSSSRPEPRIQGRKRLTPRWWCGQPPGAAVARAAGGRRTAAQVGQYPIDHVRLGNHPHDAHRVAAPGTAQRVDLEDPAEQLRPAPTGLGERGRDRLGNSQGDVFPSSQSSARCCRAIRTSSGFSHCVVGVAESIEAARSPTLLRRASDICEGSQEAPEVRGSPDAWGPLHFLDVVLKRLEGAFTCGHTENDVVF